MEKQKSEFIDMIIQKAKKINKADFVFKIIKKLKQAVEILIKLEGRPFQEITTPENMANMIVYYFGTGIQADYNVLKESCQKYEQPEVKLIVGCPYGYISFKSKESARQYMEGSSVIESTDVRFRLLNFQQGEKYVFFFYTSLKFEELQSEQKFDIPNCCVKNHQNQQDNIIPGLIIVENIVTKQEEQDLIKEIDKRKWNRLSNRKVQHYGYEFKYGRNNIDKEEKAPEMIPEFFTPLLNKIKAMNICDHDFDQLTINCYDPGDGIPTHFDTHSPFEQVFLSISLMSDIVMEFTSFRKEFQNILLRSRSMTVFTGEVRYAWTHGIAPRKFDKLNEKITYRLRRISLTFRKIRFTPCKCPYFFYCDSQGYDQDKMKKNNPLLKKYLSKQNKVEMMAPNSLEKEYVEKAYNSFGYTFSNPIHHKIIKFIQNIEPGSIVLDIGCGNGYYMNLIQNAKSIAVGIEKCVVMRNFENKPEDRYFADAIALPFKNESFDVVLMVAVFHHFASQGNRIRSLEEIERILKPSGTGIISVWSYQAKKDIYDDQQIFMDFTLPKHRKKQQEAIQQKPVVTLNTKNEIYKRYYHLFRKQQILDLFNNKESKLTITKIQQEYENYYIHILREV